MRWTAAEILDALARAGAELVDDPGDARATEIEGVSIDSRSVRAGDLFVPIVADRDGHDFIPAAAAAGAVACLVANERLSGHRTVTDPDGQPLAVISVDDTSRALLHLGRAARRRLHATVVGITGSVGKTSVKDLLGAIGAAHVVTHANVASFNNELGVPLTLLSAPEDARLVVTEMGARNIGHIALLCEIARPTIGVVTAVAAVHTELFGSLHQVAVAKGELLEALPPDGVAIVNNDDELVRAMVSRAATSRILTYGRSRAEVVFEEVEVGPDLHPTFMLRTPIGADRVRLGVAGAHMAANAAAAAAAAVGAGIPFPAIVDGLTSPIMSPHRMDVRRSPSGAVVINDAYNANPTSMRAGLRALLDVRADRRVAILGVMAELGDTSDEDHRAIAEEAAAAGIVVIAVGTPEYGPSAEHVPDQAAAIRAVGTLHPTDAVLVKGSRVAALEGVAVELAEEQRAGDD